MREVALVTGASSGIGLEITKILASQNYDLVICARREKELQDLAEEIRRQHTCLLYTSPSPRDLSTSRMPSSA